MDQPAEQHLPEFLTLEEAADLLRTTPRTLRRWTARGTVPKVPGLGRRLLYNRDALLQLGRPADEEPSAEE